MENKSLSKKIGVKKTKSMLRVFTKEWNWFIYMILFLLLSILVIMVIVSGLLFFKVIKISSVSAKQLAYFLIIAIVIILFVLFLFFFVYTNWFGRLNVYYSKQIFKYSKSNKVLSVYNEIAKKHNITFKKLDFQRIVILPSCNTEEVISVSMNKNLNNKYTFIKNNKEYNLVFGKIKYVTIPNRQDFYKEIIIEVILCKNENIENISLTKKEKRKDTNLIINVENTLNDFKLLGIQGVYSKNSNSVLKSMGVAASILTTLGPNTPISDSNAFKEMDNTLSKKTNGWTWEGYTYWNKNMKQWRKDYLQESYRLPGVWCNNDVKKEDMDEYIEKKINFECQLINDIFNNFKTD